MAIKISVVFYSTYGHIWKLAQSVADGARSVSGAQVTLYQVAETLSPQILEKMHATEAKKAFAHVPVIQADQLPEADAIIFGFPTRYGSTVAQMQQLLDATGPLWSKGALIGKVGSMFTSTASQHGGQETTLLGFSTFLFHQGMVIVGVPYSCQEMVNLSEITGGTPYGATTIAGPRGERTPTANELTIARFQGKHVAEITTKVAAK